jgi:hypothetical protein
MNIKQHKHRYEQHKDSPWPKLFKQKQDKEGEWPVEDLFYIALLENG